MPLLIGHAAIGSLTYEVTNRESALREWKVFLWVVFLANLPDIDLLMGLLTRGDAFTFHRGPTHSLAFALIAALLAAGISRGPLSLPRFGFRVCFFLIVSHVLSDAFLSDAPTSLLWPFQLSWSDEKGSMAGIIDSFVSGSKWDVWVIPACFLFGVARRVVLKQFPVRVFGIVLESRLIPFIHQR